MPNLPCLQKGLGFKFTEELLSDFYALAVFNFYKFNDSKARQIRPKGKVVRSFYKPVHIAEFA